MCFTTYASPNATSNRNRKQRQYERDYYEKCIVEIHFMISFTLQAYIKCILGRIGEIANDNLFFTVFLFTSQKFYHFFHKQFTCAFQILQVSVTQIIMKKKNQRSFTLFYFYRFELKWECVLTRWLQEKKSMKRCSYGTDLRIRFKSVNITVTSSDGANCKICDVLLYPCFSKQWIVVIGTESTKGNANSKEFWQGVYLIYKGLSYARNLVRLRIFQ